MWSTLLSVAAFAAPAPAQGYEPKVGDNVWVIVRQFPARHFQRAKNQYLRDIWSKLGKDELLRDHIVAEDRQNRRLAVVIFTDSRKQIHRGAASRLDQLAARKRSDWFRLSMINDEPITPQAGDSLIIYDNRYPKGRHESPREPQRRLMNVMREDSVNKDSYVYENPGTGHWGGLSIGRAQDHSTLTHPQWARDIARHRTSRRVETFRIIAVRSE